MRRHGTVIAHFTIRKTFPIKKFASSLKHVSNKSVTALRQIICSRKSHGPGHRHGLGQDRSNGIWALRVAFCDAIPLIDNIGECQSQPSCIRWCWAVVRLL